MAQQHNTGLNIENWGAGVENRRSRGHQRSSNTQLSLKFQDKHIATEQL